MDVIGGSGWFAVGCAGIAGVGPEAVDGLGGVVFPGAVFPGVEPDNVA